MYTRTPLKCKKIFDTFFSLITWGFWWIHVIQNACTKYIIVSNILEGYAPYSTGDKNWYWLNGMFIVIMLSFLWQSGLCPNIDVSKSHATEPLRFSGQGIYNLSMKFIYMWLNLHITSYLFQNYNGLKINIVRVRSSKYISYHVICYQGCQAVIINWGCSLEITLTGKIFI